MKSKLYLIFLMISSTLHAQVKSSLDSLLDVSVGSGEPGIALFVQINGQVLYQGGRGMSSRQNGFALNEHSNFRMASVSKQFTAMSVLLLQQEGKLSLTDPISLYFPGIPPQVSEKVQVRNLINHS